MLLALTMCTFQKHHVPQWESSWTVTVMDTDPLMATELSWVLAKIINIDKSSVEEAMLLTETELLQLLSSQMIWKGRWRGSRSHLIEQETQLAFTGVLSLPFLWAMNTRTTILGYMLPVVSPSQSYMQWGKGDQNIRTIVLNQMSWKKHNSWSALHLTLTCLP